MENTEDNQEELGGSVLFDTYLAAKKALSAKIKEIIEIMCQCKVLEVDPPEAIQFVCSKPGDVANHQWQYNAGHETIYCKHVYNPRTWRTAKCTVKIPVKCLEMTTEELYDYNRLAAIASLEEKKRELIQERADVSKPINDKIGKIDQRLKDLREARKDAQET